MITKKELIEVLKDMPDDAVVVANDGACFIALGRPVLVRKYSDHVEERGNKTIVCDKWFGPEGQDYGEVDDDLTDASVCQEDVLIVCDGPMKEPTKRQIKADYLDGSVGLSDSLASLVLHHSMEQGEALRYLGL